MTILKYLFLNTHFMFFKLVEHKVIDNEPLFLPSSGLGMMAQ